MHRRFVTFAVAAAALALGACSAGAQSAVPFPSGAPWYNVSRPLTWSDLRGRAVLLDFFTPGCINCIHMIPVEHELKRRFGERLVIVAVDSPKFSASATTQGLTAFITRYHVTHPVVLDSATRLWDAYGIPAWPTFVLVGPDGKVRGQYIGEQTVDGLAGPIRAALADAPPATALKPLPMLVMAGAGGALDAPGGISVSGDSVAIADTAHNRIVLANRNGTVTAVIGTGCEGAADGSYAQAQFARPHGLTFHAGRLYVADTDNQRIRVIDPAARTVATLAGDGRRRFIAGGEFSAASASLNSPWDVAWAGGRLYIAMAGDHDIWRYDPDTRRIGPWAGSGREGLADGDRRSAEFAQTSGLTTHAGILYAADPESSSIRAIDLARGNVTTLIGQGLFKFGFRDGIGTRALLQHAEGLTWLDGSLYIADTFNDALRRMDLKSGRVTTVARHLAQPQAVAALAPETLLVAESNGDRVVAIHLPDGKVTPWPLRGLKTPAACPANASP